MGADPNPVALHFGNNLRSHREHAGISQESLGHSASLHRTEVGLLERGARVPRIDTRSNWQVRFRSRPESFSLELNTRPA
jgi:DNA-binding XRE family transcriptional regulator